MANILGEIAMFTRVHAVRAPLSEQSDRTKYQRLALVALTRAAPLMMANMSIAFAQRASQKLLGLVWRDVRSMLDVAIAG